MIEPRCAREHMKLGMEPSAAMPMAEQMAVSLAALVASGDGAGRVALEDRAREAVRRYVVREKMEGAAPEQVLVALKAAARRAALGLSAHDAVTGIEELTAQVVAWCIADYYRAD
jgi:hypothetical protein